jgi:hypothetical protein
MALSSANLSPRGWRHSVIAARCAAIVCAEVDTSTSSFRACRRAQNILPADWLLSDGRKNR